MISPLHTCKRGLNVVKLLLWLLDFLLHLFTFLLIYFTCLIGARCNADQIASLITSCGIEWLLEWCICMAWEFTTGMQWLVMVLYDWVLYVFLIMVCCNFDWFAVMVWLEAWYQIRCLIHIEGQTCQVRDFSLFTIYLKDVWTQLNAVSNNFSDISWQPVQLLMCFQAFSKQYSTQNTFQATGCFST